MWAFLTKKTIIFDGDLHYGLNVRWIWVWRQEVTCINSARWVDSSPKISLSACSFKKIGFGLKLLRMPLRPSYITSLVVLRADRAILLGYTLMFIVDCLWNQNTSLRQINTRFNEATQPLIKWLLQFLNFVRHRDASRRWQKLNLERHPQ